MLSFHTLSFTFSFYRNKKGESWKLPLFIQESKILCSPNLKKIKTSSNVFLHGIPLIVFRIIDTSSLNKTDKKIRVIWSLRLPKLFWYENKFFLVIIVTVLLCEPSIMIFKGLFFLSHLLRPDPQMISWYLNFKTFLRHFASFLEEIRGPKKGQWMINLCNVGWSFHVI